LFLSDPISGSIASFSRVACNRPVLQVLSEDGYEIALEMDRAQLAKALQWANMAREGTRRLSFRAEGSNVTLSSGGQELSNLPAVFRKGELMTADFPADILTSIIPYIDMENVVFYFQHKTAPSILEIRNDSGKGVKARHFVQSMKERSA
jgi:hypothetical protein